jgi:hypothetical protein
MLLGAAPARAADGMAAPPAGWVVETEARIGGDATVGDARRIIHQSLDLGVGASIRRDGSAWRWRASLALEPLTDVGPGASLQIYRARLGVERDWRRHLVTALDLGGSLRRLSISDELRRSVPGIEGLVEVGWRSFLGARWALTTSLRSSTTWFVRDVFVWQEIGASLTLGRAL